MEWANGLVTGIWAGVDSAWEQEKLMAEKNARKCGMPSGDPQRPVHAGLGSALIRRLAQLLGDVGTPAPFHKICPCGFHP